MLKWVNSVNRVNSVKCVQWIISIPCTIFTIIGIYGFYDFLYIKKISFGLYIIIHPSISRETTLDPNIINDRLKIGQYSKKIAAFWLFFVNPAYVGLLLNYLSQSILTENGLNHNWIVNNRMFHILQEFLTISFFSHSRNRPQTHFLAFSF